MDNLDLNPSFGYTALDNSETANPSTDPFLDWVHSFSTLVQAALLNLVLSRS
jgi:hypothetical protein